MLWGKLSSCHDGEEDGWVEVGGRKFLFMRISTHIKITFLFLLEGPLQKMRLVVLYQFCCQSSSDGITNRKIKPLQGLQPFVSYMLIFNMFC